MSRFRLTSALVALATGAAVLAPVTAAEAAPHEGNRSLAKVLAADGNRFDDNWSDFDIVDRAVRTVLKEKPDSAVGVLADGKVRLTAFIPTDRAFRKLVTDLTGKHRSSEKRVFTDLAGLVDVDTLEQVLLYHVVPGATITYRQAQHSDGAKLKTALEGGTLTVNVGPKKHVWLRDADKDDRNARVLRAAKNINQGNKQIAHGVNRVLRPIDL